MGRAKCDCLVIVQIVPAMSSWSYPCAIRTSGKPAVLDAIWSHSLFMWLKLNLNIWKSHLYLVLSCISFATLEIKEIQVREERMSCFCPVLGLINGMYWCCPCMPFQPGYYQAADMSWTCGCFCGSGSEMGAWEGKPPENLCPVCYSEAKSQDLNSSWVFWVKTNLKMQMQSLWSRAGMRGKERLIVYLLLKCAGTVFSTSCTHQKSYCTSFLLLLWHCFRESLSAPHVRPCVEKPLPANCSILSTLLNCFWYWHQTVSLSNLVFHSTFVTLGLGKPLACASLLPVREEEANEAENLSWKHQEELLPASMVGWREGAVSTSHVGEKLGALLKWFLRSEGKKLLIQTCSS